MRCSPDSAVRSSQFGCLVLLRTYPLDQTPWRNSLTETEDWPREHQPREDQRRETGRENAGSTARKSASRRPTANTRRSRRSKTVRRPAARTCPSSLRRGSWQRANSPLQAVQQRETSRSSRLNSEKATIEEAGREQTRRSRWLNGEKPAARRGGRRPRSLARLCALEASSHSLRCAGSSGCPTSQKCRWPSEPDTARSGQQSLSQGG